MENIVINPLFSKNPCKDCKDRYVGCHGKCDIYQELNRKNKELQKERAKKRELERDNKKNYRGAGGDLRERSSRKHNYAP